MKWRGRNVENLTKHVCSKSRVQQLDGLILRAKQYETLTRVDPTCKGYPVKKSYVPYPTTSSRVPFIVGTASKAY